MSTNVRSSLEESLRVEAAEQLERILADRHFVAAPRGSRFLRYVVEQALAGRADEIKELVIAMDVYARAADYDPKADSTVRVEASRLRVRLQRYYTEEGARDPIRITIPKGTYVPRFERVQSVAAARAIEAAGPLPEAGPRPPGQITERRIATVDRRRADRVGVPWAVLLLAGMAMTPARAARAGSVFIRWARSPSAT